MDKTNRRLKKVQSIANNKFHDPFAEDKSLVEKIYRHFKPQKECPPHGWQEFDRHFVCRICGKIIKKPVSLFMEDPFNPITYLAPAPNLRWK